MELIPVQHRRDVAPPPFHLTSTAAGTTRTVSLVGELDLGVVADVRAALAAALDDAPETLVVDLGETTFIDSAGVHAMVAAHRFAGARDVRLVMLPAPPAVQRTVALCALETGLPFALAANHPEVPSC